MSEALAQRFKTQLLIEQLEAGDQADNPLERPHPGQNLIQRRNALVRQGLVDARGTLLAITYAPAALAAAMPLGESSTTTTSLGSTPRAENALKYTSGNGLWRAHSSPLTT